MIKRGLLTLALIAAPLIMLPAVSSAQKQSVDPFKTVCGSAANTGTGGNSADSAVCKDKELNGENPLFGPQGVITKVINLLTAVVAIVAVISIILAGIKFIGSGNNPQEISKAREQIIYSVVALVVAAIAQLIVRFILGKV